jgi:hypothetical protein
VTVVVTGIPSGVTFTGDAAEWPMDRPSVNGSISNLADDSSANILSAWAVDYERALHLYTSDNSYQLTMTNDSDVLSSVATDGAEARTFTWPSYD